MPAQQPRETREASAREATQRPIWKPLDQYPIPKADGLRFRWIRTLEIGNQGVADTRNVSRRFREGWVPSRASDYPELMMRSDERSQFPDGIEVAGMLLCQCQALICDARNEYYRNMSENQMKSVDLALARSNSPGDHGMQILNPRRRTRVAVGRQASRDLSPED